MSPVLAVTLRYATVPVVFTVVGAALGIAWRDAARIRTHVLHLAAGVVFAVVATELLPEIQRRALVGDVVIGFAAGIAVMILVDRLLDRIKGDDDAPVSADARIGMLLALAEAAEQLSVGLALAGELRVAKLSPRRILFVVTALGSLVFVSAVAGATVLSGLRPGAMATVLSFGAAALLYLVTNELLREAHEEPESAGGTAMFFVGFLAFLVIGMSLD